MKVLPVVFLLLAMAVPGAAQATKPDRAAGPPASGRAASAEASKVHRAVRSHVSGDGYVPVLIVLSDQPQAAILDRAERAATRRLEAAKRSFERTVRFTPFSDAQIRQSEAAYHDIVREVRRNAFSEVEKWIRPQQDGLEAKLLSFGARYLRRFTAINMIAAHIPVSAAAALAADPAVAEVMPDQALEAQLDVSVATVGAGAFWDASYTGIGERVAVLDSGVAFDHPALAGRVSNHVFLGEASRGKCFDDDLSTGYDLSGHGTHVAGIIASGGSTECPNCRGVARGLGTLYNVKIAAKLKLDTSISCSGKVSAAWSDITDALDWIARDGTVKIINFSFSTSPEPGATFMESEMADYGARLWDWFSDTYGLTVAVAAGNYGGPACPAAGCVGSPGTAFNVITVANADDNGTSARIDDTIASESSRGPVTRPWVTNGEVLKRQKPDISAPGTRIRSSAFDWKQTGREDYVVYSGTSMSTPHIAGAAALVRNAGVVDPLAIKALLLNTADPDPQGAGSNGWKADWGWGYVNLNRLFGQRGNALTGSAGPSAFRLFVGEASTTPFRATLTWNRHFASGNFQRWSSPYFRDLDLYLYDAHGNRELAKSESGPNNVEQVFAAEPGRLLVKVKVFTSDFGENNPVERFGLALSHEGFVPAEGPRFSLSCSAPPAVTPNAPFQVSCHGANMGDLSAFSTTGTLTAPAGFGGASVTDLGQVNPGATFGPFWRLTAPSSTGTYQLEVVVQSTSFGEGFSAALPVTVEVVPACTMVLSTMPPGLATEIDGQPYSAPVSVACGSTHTISAASPQNGVAGTRYLWSSWSDGGSRTHEIRAPASGSTTFTANFTTQYFLTTSASPVGGGWVSPSNGAYYDAGAWVAVSASPSSGYRFSNWTGGVANSTAPATTVLMNAPRTLAARFEALPVAVPDLTIAKTHSGDFRRGGASNYSITVRNAGNASTTGPVTVTESLPAGLTVSSMSGTGWNCNATVLSCSRSDALGAGNSYPGIVLSVFVAANAPDSVTNVVTVSGGGETNTGNNTASDTTAIGGPNSIAQFRGTDTVTRGTWKGTYGTDGFVVVNGGTSAAAGIAASGNLSHTWSASTPDQRALQKPGATADRIAAVWYAPAQMSVDLAFTDSLPHQIAVYCLDWDSLGRVQTFEILNSSGTVLDTRTVNNFGGGVWLVWTVSGNVRLRISRVAGLNAVVSGLMIGGTVPGSISVTVNPGLATLQAGQSQPFTATVQNASTAAVSWSISPNIGSITSGGMYLAPTTVAVSQNVVITATSLADGATKGTATVTLTPAGQPGQAQFVHLDSATQGNWKATYGRDGYAVVNHAQSNPSYVAPTQAGTISHTWAASTADRRALQKAGTAADRIAAAWYTPNQMTMDLPFTDSEPHQVAVYCLDWDYLARVQTIEVLNGSGAVLDSTTVRNFGGGVWVVWSVSGHVQLRVTRVSGVNAVISGLMVGGGGATAAAAPTEYLGMDPAAKGNWQSAYGADGYIVVNNAIVNPSYVTPAPSGNLGHTWAATTTDDRALLKAGSTSDRIASAWYAPNQMTIDLPFTDGRTHRMAVYCLDWDRLGRAQTLELLGPGGEVLDIRTASNFGNGVWLVWNVSGRVKLRVTRLSGPNAVISGLMF